MRRVAALLLPLCLVSCSPRRKEPLAGRWVDDGWTFLHLRDNHTFAMGYTDESGVQHPDVAGTWRTDSDKVIFTVETSSNCNVAPAEVMRWGYRVIDQSKCEFTYLYSGHKEVFERAP